MVVTAAGVQAEVRHGIERLPQGTTLEVLSAALSNSTIPKYGELDSFIGQRVRELRAEVVDMSPDKVFVTVVYGAEQGGGGFHNDPDDAEVLPQIEITTSLQPVTTQFDVAGNALKVSFVEEDPESQTSEKKEQGGEVEIVVPMHTVIARRRERLSSGLWSVPFDGFMNGDPVFGDPVHFWRLSVDSSSEDGGATYNVTYTFVRNPDTWNTVIVYRDPMTGVMHVQVTKPPNMLVGAEGNGSKVVQIVRTAMFRNVGPSAALPHIPPGFFS